MTLRVCGEFTSFLFFVCHYSETRVVPVVTTKPPTYTASAINVTVHSGPYFYLRTYKNVSHRILKSIEVQLTSLLFTIFTYGAKTDYQEISGK